jgi:hypothetical protein
LSPAQTQTASLRQLWLKRQEVTQHERGATGVRFGSEIAQVQSDPGDIRVQGILFQQIGLRKWMHPDSPNPKM